MPKKARARGRPPLPVERRLQYRLNVYLTNADGDWLEARAKTCARHLSDVVRRLVADERARAEAALATTPLPEDRELVRRAVINARAAIKKAVAP